MDNPGSAEPSRKDDARASKAADECDEKRREQFADFFTDAAFAGCVVGIAHLADYRMPSLTLFGHILSLFMLPLISANAAADADETKLSGSVPFVCAFGIAVLVQIDVNFLLHVVCALDPDGCCGEPVSREPTILPACSGSVPNVSVLGGVTLLVAALLLVLWGLRRWVDFITQYPPGAISLALVIKSWQISFVGEWRDELTIFSVAVLILSFCQLLFAILDFAAQSLVLQNPDAKVKHNFRSKVFCICGMCAAYVSGTVQILLLDQGLKSSLYGEEAVAPVVNLVFTTVVFFVFLTRASYNAGATGDGKKRAAWITRTPVGQVLCPACIFTAVLLFFCALVLLEKTSFFAATTFSSAAYIIMLPLRLSVYTVNEDSTVYAYLATFFLADAAFLGIVVSRRQDEHTGAFFCLSGALFCSLVHTIACAGLYWNSSPKSENSPDGASKINGNPNQAPGEMFPFDGRRNQRGSSFPLKYL